MSTDLQNSLTSHTHPPYKHKPLSPGRHIRVFLLQPDPDHDAPIRIELREISLPEEYKVRVQYEALSYVWGAKDGDQEIECDGRSLLVTHNCLTALRFLRFARDVRTLWIDAICIDQTADNNQEKNHQLKLMGDVYARAQRVLVWLGHGDEKVMELFARIARSDREDYSPTAVQALISNEWFSRAWTVQELCYGEDVLMIYGQSHVSWETFAQCLDWRHHSSVRNGIPVSVYVPYINTTSFCGLFRILSDPEKLTDRPRPRGWIGVLAPLVFGLLRSRRSSNPQDQIYAFHHVLTDIGFELPAPDVAKPVTELYEEVTFSLIQQSRSLRILDYGMSHTRMDNLPSWVPDFSQNLWPPGHVLGPNALNVLPEGQILERTPGSLKLRGIVWDAVNICSDGMPDFDQGRRDPHSQHQLALRILDTIYSWMQLVQDLSIPIAFDALVDEYSMVHPKTYHIFNEEFPITYPDSRCSVRLMALVHLIVSTMQSKKLSSDYISSLQLTYAVHPLWHRFEFVHDLARRRALADTYPDPSIAEKLRTAHPYELIKLIHDHEKVARPHIEDHVSGVQDKFMTKEREGKLFITHRGGLGLTAADARSGDYIVLLPGSACPMILRLADQKEPVLTFRVVGLAEIPECREVEWNEPEKVEGELRDIILI